MSSIVWLCLTAVFVAAVALTRTGPRGGKPVANTRLMASARHVLVLGIIICAVLGVFSAFRPR